jgi:excisionase family DNA binding protein
VTTQPKPPAVLVAEVPRLALSVSEACESLGVGWDLFHERIEPELKAVRLGRRKLYPVSELERWLADNAARVLADEA